MYRKFFFCLALCGLSSVANAQQPTQGYLVQPIANPAAAGYVVGNNGVPANVAPVQAPAAFAAQQPTNGAFAIGAPAGRGGPLTVMSQQPHPVVPSNVVYPVPIAPGQGTISGMAPLPTVAATSTWTQSAPQVTRQTQTYTPTYYYYYYQPPYQVTHMTPVYSAPAVQNPYVYGGGGGGYQTAGPFGPMTNARGEMGHIRLPYYSYRRPWYYPGQPSFNVTIPGPVW
jgi:hypothetical protein